MSGNRDGPSWKDAYQRLPFRDAARSFGLSEDMLVPFSGTLYGKSQQAIRALASAQTEFVHVAAFCVSDG